MLSIGLGPPRWKERNTASACKSRTEHQMPVIILDKGPSPRGRGNPFGPKTAKNQRGTIPARAGEPKTRPRPPAAATDHPRAGGGTWSWSPCILEARGPSPRGRGNPKSPAASSSCARTIPARAGEPRRTAASRPMLRDHPRAGGGTLLMGFTLGLVMGPSPRGRGNHGGGRRRPRYRGTIPARAGEPRPDRCCRSWPRDHPRAGGGTLSFGIFAALAEGPSPRGRGNLVAGDDHDVAVGTIPARAGEPMSGC